MKNKLFNDSKYTAIYWSIINKAKQRTPENIQYFERHHIIPKCLGGDNQHENIAHLTAREHFLCHRLLTKMTTGVYKQKMVFAVHMMMHSRHDKISITSRTYNSVRNAMNKVRKSPTYIAAASKRMKARNLIGSKNHMYKIGKNHPLYGKSRSKETRDKISRNHVSRVGSNNTNAKHIRLQSPDGTIYDTYGGLKQFCEARQLAYSSMRFILKQQREFTSGSVAGWKCWIVE